MPPSPAPRHLGDSTVTPRVLLISSLACVVGAVSAVVALLLLRLIGLATNLFFLGRFSTELVSVADHHRGYGVLLVPVLGGLIVGLMARYGSERIRGHGMPEALEAVLVGGSRVQPRVAVLKPISAAVSIGSGGPFGAEGPIIMTGGAVGSVLAQLLRLTADERKTLLVAGAAGGMAAVFNAPLAALLLAVELLLLEYRARSLIPVASAVAVATGLRLVLLGTGAAFPVLGPLGDVGGLVLLAAVPVGLAAAVAAIGMTWLVHASEDVFHRLPVHWMWWPAIGGLIIGIGGLIAPRALGVGYDTITGSVQGTIAVSVLALAAVVKAVIWGLSLGSGTSGGVVAPLLFVGAGLGAVLAPVLPGSGVGLWPVVAMAAVLAAALRVPLTGIVFALEITHAWDALLPALIAAACAYTVSVLLLRRSVLTEKIARHGHHLVHEYDVDPLAVLLVREVMSTDVVTVASDAPVEDVSAVFAREARTHDATGAHRQRLYPVLDGQGSLRGVVTRRDLVDVSSEGGADVALVDLVQLDPVVCHPDDTLQEVAHLMALAKVSRLPVVTRDQAQRLVGMISLSQLLQGRVRDLQEARVSERVLTLRLLRGRRSATRG